MKNKYKKIILIIVMIVSLIGIAVTILYAKNNISTTYLSGGQQTIEQSMNGTMPLDMPNDTNGNIGQPPSENGNSMGQPLVQNGEPNNMMQVASLTTPYIVVIGLFSCLFSLCLIYLLMSNKNEKFYKNSDKLIIYFLANIILIGIITIGTTLVTNNLDLNNSKVTTEENQEKDKVVLDESNVITENEIDLNSQNTDVTITKTGTYTFSGKFTHSIIVDAESEDVEIILNGVEITNEKTATIIGLSANKITITLANGSENILSDGGNSEYDGCIFSNAELVFDGTGNLTIKGNQNEGEGIATEAQNITFNDGNYNITSNDDGINAGGDGATITINDGNLYIDASGDGIDSNKNAIINGGKIFVVGSDVGGDAGIDTDEGFEINGGLVVALGSDMIETPLDTSNQKTIAFSLSESISKDKIVTLLKDEKEIVSFKSSKNFKTIIISTSTLEDGDYTLYTGGSNNDTLNNGIYENSSYIKGEKIVINNIDTFTISKTVNLFGN